MGTLEEAKQGLEKELLSYLATNGPISSTIDYVEKSSRVGFPPKTNRVEVLHNLLKSLKALGMVEIKSSTKQVPVLTKDGEKWVAEGSPEFQIYAALTGPMEKKALLQSLKSLGKSANPGMSVCIKQGWVVLQADKKTVERKAKPDTVVDSVQQQLMKVKNGEPIDQAALKLLKKRKMTSTKKVNWYEVKKGPKFALERKTLESDLSQEMLLTGSWKNAEFKKYSMTVEPRAAQVGALHPLMKVRTEFRQILLEMGFSEMPTNNFVESSFWNFDTLFQPQQHPARDAHDTFFLNQPKKCLKLIDDYVKRVKDMHEKGGHGSIGYRYDWSLEESKKNILRTHTTAVSSRMLYKLAQEKPFKPQKYFSIDRVFRNESLDSTHLAEFHQVEGLVADRGLSLSNLIGTIKTFFTRIGVDDVKFKPAYNPYTEPSMEIFGYSKELKKWIEIGNSGMFRPEMLAPMGLPEDVTVIAW
eukprot:CAMPEP_0114506606 /NCGR_PEP_ID=MMETSP0109-20121206/11516_1 /TAXON_ID=29199 /ORGANISM="Chlorarachnion reptans, Strain CCCM449" /LENGTH=470 /DNA_ID=CAMNT_0001685203 /DNA_START=344 /DNA_END=1753 /DNA_ORIENTATION=-